MTTGYDTGLPSAADAPDLDTLMERIRRRVRGTGVADGEAPTGSDRAAVPTAAGADGQSDGAPASDGQQADFNRSVVRAVELVLRRLEDAHVEVALLEDRLRGQADRQADALDERLARLSARIDEVGARVDARAEEAEARVSGAVESLRRQLEAVQAALDADLAAERQERSRAQAELSGRVDMLAERSDRLELAQHEADQRARVDRGRVEERIGRVESGLNDVARRAEAAASRVVDVEGDVRHELEEARMRLLRAERRVRTLQDAPAAPQASDASSAPASTTESPLPPGTMEAALSTGSDPAPGVPPAFDYFLFEQRFRGTRADIKRRQEKYVGLFAGREKIVDLACGRGEFVELLVERGLDVTGIDLDADMALFCRDLGLPVIEADAFEYLAGAPDGSLGGLFAAQLVEHLAPERIHALVRLCHARLGPGGVVVMETVNPGCPLALGNFYLDPTHVRPVPAQMLRFMLEQEGFRVERTVFSSLVPDRNGPPVLDVAGDPPAEATDYQDYAVVARRR